MDPYNTCLRRTCVVTQLGAVFFFESQLGAVVACSSTQAVIPFLSFRSCIKKLI
jgi:hypothetical protein